MKILFNIQYDTTFGEELVLTVVKEKTATTERHTQYRMHTQDGHLWQCELRVDKRSGEHIDYYYTVVRGEDAVVHQEWKVQAHRLEINATGAKSFTVNDRWKGIPEDSYLYSSAFTDCIRKRKPTAVPLSDYAVTVRFKVRAPQLAGNQRLTLVGSDPALGAWHTDKGIGMYEHQYNEWVADIDATLLESGNFEYKFVAVDDRSNATWEDGMNRQADIPMVGNGSVIVYEDDMAFFPIYNIRCAGTQVPLFSLRSEESYGVGDFGDLQKMTDWMAATGQRILQLLPINDTTMSHTWTDSYPYNCTSIFALHPMYACLASLPRIKDKKKAARFEALRKELNALKQVDYERVCELKNDYLQELFLQEGAAMMRTREYKQFFAENAEWLVPYAQYRMLREQYGTPDFTRWKGHTTFHEKDRAALTNPLTEEYRSVAFFYFTQHILYSQMSAAHAHARSKGVVLKGDIPIGVNRYGCDTWQQPRYFNMNGQAGAPPDAFSQNGQNWGFPTYCWPEMLKDGCRWWKRRFANMAQFFDAYRIDHVLGFFRIWEIPLHSVHGLLGHFSPALALTRDEIEAYGLHFDEQLMTEPFICDWVLGRVFGHRASMIRDKYLDATGNGSYRLKPEYNTQRKIEQAFKGRTDAEYTAIRDGLYSMVSDVLFLRDHTDPEKFHPRITVQYDFVYEQLSDADKAAFNSIYDDYFYRRNNQFWYREAMMKLPHITQATRMLTCAEDLGMVPQCVSVVMDELRILSLEMQTMPKQPGLRFGILANNPYRSVCTISSHDTPTLRQWWDEDEERAQDYYNNMLRRYGPAPHPLPGTLAREIIRRHLECPSMLCIVALQDWLATDDHLRNPDKDMERVNVPSNPYNYWRYRMHTTIEELMKSAELNSSIAGIIKESGRI